MKKKQKQAAKEAKARAAEKAAEDSCRRDRERLWDLVPQLYRPVGDHEDLRTVEGTEDSSERRTGVATKHPQREFAPAVLKMQAVAQREAAALACEENAVVLAVEMSLVDEEHA